jgi:phosphohistidine phosphatase
MSRSRKAAAPPPERFLVLLRHGIAEERSDEKKDEDRGLTTKGHARTKQVARGLREILPDAQAIYTSPLLRAMQTALWVSRAYRSRVPIQTTDSLAPGTPAKDFLKMLAAIEERRAILVGHEPALTDDLFALIGLKGGAGIELRKGGCYGVRLLPDGTAKLEWVLPPRLLRRLGR